METQTLTPGGFSSSAATWGSAPNKLEEEIPESEVERWSGVRSRLDTILGVLTGGRWSSAEREAAFPRGPGVI